MRLPHSSKYPRVEIEVIEPERRTKSGDVAHADGEGHAENQREYRRRREQLAQADRGPARGRRVPWDHAHNDRHRPPGLPACQGPPGVETPCHSLSEHGHHMAVGFPGRTARAEGQGDQLSAPYRSSRVFTAPDGSDPVTKHSPSHSRPALWREYIIRAYRPDRLQHPAVAITVARPRRHPVREPYEGLDRAGEQIPVVPQLPAP